MFNKKFLVILLLPCFSFVCISKKMLQDFIEVHNQLHENIYCIPSYDYPDTLFPLYLGGKEGIFGNDYIYRIDSLSNKKLFYQNLCNKAVWERLVSSNVLQVFVFNSTVLHEKSWSEIMSKHLYYRLSYTYDDIIRNGCTITINDSILNANNSARTEK